MPEKNSTAQSNICQEVNENVGQNSHVPEPSSFWFPVYEGVFEHAAIIRDAIWLFLWLIARTTWEEGGRGSVLGGTEIPDDRPAKDLGFPVKTIRRWRGMLVRDGYIAAHLASHGFRYTIARSKKWQGRSKAGLPKLPTSPDRGLPPRAGRLPAAGNQRVCILNDNTGTTQKVSHDGRDRRTKSLSLNRKIWEELKIANLPMRFNGFVGLVEANPRGEAEHFVPWARRILGLCKEQEIDYPKVFLRRLGDAERALESEDDPYCEIARVASPRGPSPEYEAEQRARQEREEARFNALSREEKLAELSVKLADHEEWLTPAIKAGKQPAKWALDYKAELERKIAEYSSPECQEEISLSPEEEFQLLSHFPEAWDSSPIEEYQDVAA
jgi:hypothetical protein